MRRRNLLATVAAGGAATALAAAGVARSGPKLHWRLSSAFPRDLDLLFCPAEDLASHVATLTGGNFQIEVFPLGEIVRQPRTVEAVGSGTIEMAHTASYYYWGTDPTFALGTAIPFGLNARLMNAWLYQGGGNDLLNAFFAKHNLYGLPGGNTGAQMGGWWRKEIKSLADLQGLKMRIATVGQWAGERPGLGGMVLEKLGVLPQRVRGGDIYPSLESGAIDAAEYLGPYDDEKLEFYRVAPYYYYPAFWEAGPSMHFFVNLDRWNELPADYQAALTTAASYANVDMLARHDALNAGALRRLVANGAQLRAFPSDVMEAGLAAADELHAKLAAENAEFKTIFESQREFLDEGYHWSQVADYSYDSFMIRSRSKS